MSAATDQQVLNMLAAGGSIMHPSPAGTSATGKHGMKLKSSYVQARNEISPKLRLGTE